MNVRCVWSDWLVVTVVVIQVRCVLCDWLVVTVRWAGCHESEVCLE